MQEVSGMLVRLPETTVVALARQIRGDEDIVGVIGRLAKTHALTPTIASPNSSGPDATRRPRTGKSRYAITTLGEEASFQSLADCLVHAIDVLAGLDPAFLPRFAKRGGRTRRHVADARDAIYPGRADLLKYVRELPSHPGWWVGTNYSWDDVERILGDAANVAGLDYGTDIRLRNCS